MPSHNDQAADVISVEGRALKWTSPGGDEGQVDLDDIVCVVPSPSPERQPGHRILFLEDKEGQSNDNDTTTRLGKIDISFLPAALTSFLAEIPTHLQPGAEPVQVVISTRSGTGTAQTVFEDLVKPFLVNLGVEYQAHETQSTQTIIELSQSQFLSRATIGVSQTIILLSGDGGLIDILDVFSRSKETIQTAPNIALIPCGTGNAMASSLGLRSGPASGLAPLLRGQPLPLPTFAVKLSPGSQMVIDEGNGRAPINAASDASYQTMYGAVVASWGLHAALVADSDTTEYRKFGSERFKMAAQGLLHPSDGSESHRFRGQITMTTCDGQSADADANDDTRRETLPDIEHMYLLATLVPRLEKDFLISPDSEPLSGKMRFLRFGPMSPEEAMHLMTLAYQGGQHVHEKSVTYKEVETVRIDFREEEERWRRVCIDGKIVAVEKDGWMELSKESRRVLNVIKP